jgi:hypothetical protein
MIWFFDRDDESLNVEMRYDNATSEFVVVVHLPQGPEQQTRFSDTAEFRKWLDKFQLELTLERWRRRGGPVILPHGWPDQPLT